MKPIYTLHKLQQGYVLTSDEEIKERFEGYLLDDEGFIRHGMSDIKALLSFNGKKVIAQDFDFSSLSPEDQKEIGWFDVEKISYDWLYDNEENMPKGYPLKPMEYGFQQGFQKAQELLVGFTLDDIRNALSESFKASQEGYNITSDEIIKSLLQKSWEVEVEMDCTLVGLDLADDCKPKLTNGKIKILRLIK
jgi:hypothetical protein